MPDRFELVEVEYLPDDLVEGRLYFSREYSIAAHKCACGCGSAVYTPIKAGEWQLSIEPRGATLFPSIGNWNLPCRSHYWLRGGRIQWSVEWSQAQIEAGRAAEERRRLQLHGQKYGLKKWLSGTFARLLQKIGDILKK